MGLIIGSIAILIDIVGSIIILFANGMVPAPSASNAMSIWPWLLIWLVIGAILIFTHYHHIGW